MQTEQKPPIATTMTSTDDEKLESQTQSRVDVEIETGEQIFPDGGYGWVCVVATFLINAHSWGINTVSTTQGRLNIMAGLD